MFQTPVSILKVQCIYFSIYEIPAKVLIWVLIRYMVIFQLIFDTDMPTVCMTADLSTVKMSAEVSTVSIFADRQM